jgi:hypothetical protein
MADSYDWYESATRWLAHYTVGIAFAGLGVAMLGRGWIQNPSLWPAVAFGMATVVAPLFIMQPAMGSGFASARTPAPLKNCLRSLANHTAFGFGFYVSALLITLAS